MSDERISTLLQSIWEQLPESVKLVAVSKFRPEDQLLQAYDCGQRIFAESRPAEFKSKAESLPKDIIWHFIGHLQTNKIALVLPYVSLIHSVDSLHLMEAINKYCLQHARTADILLEVHVAMETTKQGFSPDELPSVLGHAASMPGIRVCGLMGMASHTDDTSRIRADFRQLKSLFDSMKNVAPACFTELSMGMSDDWKIAVEEGSTMVRIGSAIFT